MSNVIETTASEQLRLSSRGYRILRKLGEGTYANVYLTEYKNPKTEKIYQLACKIMDTTKIPKEFVRKFLPREVEILAKLSHPHIIQIQNIFLRKNKYFIFMRYAENGDLLEFVLRKGALSEAQARVWFRQLVLAIQYLHEMDIAHRDLKCENIFITTNYNIKLADFGFARYVIDQQGRKITSDTYCGSLSYAPPEILRGLPYYPKISDMWSLGVILYIILNKAMPFDDGNVKRLYEHQTHKRWRFRAKVVDSLSEQCKVVAAHLLEPDIFKRWTVDQVFTSDWIAMDDRLVELTESEQAAYKRAKDLKKKYLSGLDESALSSAKPKRIDSVEDLTIDRMDLEKKASSIGLASKELQDTKDAKDAQPTEN